MNQSAKSLMAEMTGTFLFVFAGAGSVCVGALTDGSVGLVGIALAHGLALAAAMAALGRVSGGQFNPAVTVALAVTGRVGSLRAGLNVAGQLTGAALAAFLLGFFLPPEIMGSPCLLGAPAVNDALITPGRAAGVEAVLTFGLVLAFVGSGRPLAVGAAVAAGTILAGPLTGAAMNPARAFGPALLTGFADHWVYWVGPLLGGVFAAWLHDFLAESASRPGRRR